MSMIRHQPAERDVAVRVEAFRWLREQAAALGDVLPIDLLRNGFQCEGERVPLMGPQGIVTGKYLATWPVFIVGDNPGELAFTVAADDVNAAEPAARGSVTAAQSVLDASGRRAYITATMRVRLHQRGFRERVLRAYEDQCALCRLRHRDLLDAAHIVPDHDPAGDPLVSNGLSLCKIHHAAFDRRLLGIRPDYVVEVHPKVLHETDGPMLRHGLQGLHKTSLVLPRARRDYPDPERLKNRYALFSGAA